MVFNHPYFETHKKARDNTAKRLEERLVNINPSFNPSIATGLIFGGKTYKRDEKGIWTQLIKTKNPAYWNQDMAYCIADASTDTMSCLFFRFPISKTTSRNNISPIIVKAMRRIVSAEWKKSLNTTGLVCMAIELSRYHNTKKGLHFVWSSAKKDFIKDTK